MSKKVHISTLTNAELLLLLKRTIVNCKLSKEILSALIDQHALLFCADITSSSTKKGVRGNTISALACFLKTTHVIKPVETK